MRRAVLLTVALAVGVALLGAADGAAVRAQATQLVATVGPDFTIVLQNAQGTRVTRLEPGTYEIEVRDLSELHNFRLRGPGVDRATGFEDTGTETWTVTLRDGVYTYLCDPHSETMRGAFAVGDATLPATPATPATPSAPQAPTQVTPRTRLVLTSGPGFAITLRTAAGRQVRTMRRGTYTVVVRDRSRFHNARVVAPGYGRATTLPFVGSQTWRVRLARAGTLRFLCDPHASQGMRGSARVVR